MSLFEDFLARKCTVLCSTEVEQKAFQTYISGKGMRWVGGEDPISFFPSNSPPTFYYTNPDFLGGNKITFSGTNMHTDLPVVNYPDLAEEISPKEIPSPLALLTSRR
ncbi:MAG: hypothetical protein ACI4KR_00430 [Ruminiclostridium sp.]